MTEKEFLGGEAEWYKRVYGVEITEEELKDKLQFWKKTRDLDGSGDVQWHEYAEAKALLILDQQGKLRECLTKDEVADAQAAFKTIDKSGDGKITESEARAFYKARADRDVENRMRTSKNADAWVEKQVRTLFMFKDADGSGEVDFDEFLQEEAKNIIGDRARADDEKESMVGAAGATEGAGEAEDGAPASILTEEQIEHARMKFNDWDKDGNGHLEVKELQGIAKELTLKMTAKKFREGIKKMFKQVDANGDKKLSFEEFVPIYNFIYLSEMNFDDF